MKHARNIEDLVLIYPGPAFCCLDDGSEPIFNKTALALANVETLPMQVAGELAAQGDTSATTWRMNIGEGTHLRTLEWLICALSPDAILALGRDVSVENQLSKVLEDERGRYHDFLDLSHDVIWETDANGRFLFVSPRGGFGYEQEELSGQPSGILLSEEEDASSSPFTSKQMLDQKETWIQNKHGGLTLVSISAHPIRKTDGHITGFRGLCRLIGETSIEDPDRPDNLQRVAEHVLHPFLTGDGATASSLQVVSAISKALSAAGTLIALKPPAAPLAYPAAFSLPPSSKTTEQLLRAISHGDSPNLSDNLMLAPAWSGGEILGGLAVWRQEKPFSAIETRLFSILAEKLGPALASTFNMAMRMQKSRMDSLTGIANLMHFEETGQKMLGHGMPATLMYLSLDIAEKDSSKIEDILRQTSGILLGAIRRNDLAARVGEHAFAILVEGGSQEAVSAIKSRIKTSSMDIKMPVTFHIGTSPVRTGDNMATLLERAKQEAAQN